MDTKVRASPSFRKREQEEAAAPQQSRAALQYQAAAPEEGCSNTPCGTTSGWTQCTAEDQQHSVSPANPIERLKAAGKEEEGILYPDTLQKRAQFITPPGSIATTYLSRGKTHTTKKSP